MLCPLKGDSGVGRREVTIPGITICDAPSNEDA
jgi:hypothetical protein